MVGEEEQGKQLPQARFNVIDLCRTIITVGPREKGEKHRDIIRGFQRHGSGGRGGGSVVLALVNFGPRSTEAPFLFLRETPLTAAGALTTLMPHSTWGFLVYVTKSPLSLGVVFSLRLQL